MKCFFLYREKICFVYSVLGFSYGLVGFDVVDLDWGIINVREYMIEEIIYLVVVE